MLQVHLSNNIRIRGASTPLRAAVTAALTIDNPEFIKAKKRRRPTWGMEKSLQLYVYDQGDLIAPRGFIEQLKTILEQQGLQPNKVITIDQVEGQAVDFGTWNPAFIIREYQAPLIAAITAQNGVGVAPAGSGKTIMGMKYIHDVGRPALWLTHTKDLMEQTKERALSVLSGVGEVGILGDNKVIWGSGKLIIATVQTLQANPKLVDTLKDLIGVVIIDEAHHFPAAQFVDTAAKFPAARIIGLTATPDRKDQLDLYMYMGIGPQLYVVDRGSLYDNGQLVKPEVKFVYTKFNYEQASIKDGDNVDAGGEDIDYTELLNKLINDRDRAMLVAENILENAGNGTSLVITESVRYCFYLMEQVKILAHLKGWAIPRMAAVHGGLQRYAWKVARNEKAAASMVAAGEAVEYKYNDKARRFRVKVPNYTEAEFAAWQVTGVQRKQILQDVRDKKIDILFATQLAREGLDIAHLSVGHMAMPKNGDSNGSNDGGAVEQEIGRIMRPDPSNPNKKALWFDYVDYEVGIFQNQYYSRRKVYTRLGLTAPKKKPKEAERDIIDAFLSNYPI